jgi:O-antigen/teichoic acid export membrane protein
MKMLRISPLVKEASTLVSGNAVAQVISLLAYLVLTRIYTPEDYALFNIFYSYIEVLIILSTCKYEMAIVVARNEAESAAVARVALLLNTAVSLLLLAVATLLYLTHSLPGNFGQIGAVVLLIPPMVFLCGTSRVYEFIFNRALRYRTMATNALINSTTGSAFKIGFGLLGMHRAGMPLGTVLGQACANVAYRIQLRRLALPKPSRQEMIAAARAHHNFPYFVATKDFVNSLSANLPFLWLALWFDQAEVGLLGLALTFLCRPTNLVNSAVERVLYARTAQQVQQHAAIGGVIRRYLRMVNAVALPVCVVGWFIAEPLFAFFFGGRWAGCGIYVQALLPWVFLSLSSTPLTFVSNILSTQRTEFFFYIGLLALRAAAIGAGIMAGSFLLAVRLYATAGALVSVSLLVWYLWQVRRYERNLTS